MSKISPPTYEIVMDGKDSFDRLHVSATICKEVWHGAVDRAERAKLIEHLEKSLAERLAHALLKGYVKLDSRTLEMYDAYVIDAEVRVKKWP